MAVQRADARRNYARILAIAEEEVAARGADASLEQIARTAGVGSATVRRHFPSRSALLGAVFDQRVAALCARAAELTEASDARAALLEWLSACTEYATSSRGMADALILDEPDSASEESWCCSARLTEAADPLVRNAVRAGAVAPEVSTADLLTLLTGIALATAHQPNPTVEGQRLLDLVVTGISPPG